MPKLTFFPLGNADCLLMDLAGGEKYFVITKATIHGENGAVSGFITVHADVSDFKRTEENLIKAKQTAEQAMRARSQFLANMSHEIRTPMNGVLGMAGMLAETPLNAEQQEYLQTIRNSGDSLLKIVNDILDFSKIEAGKVEIEHTEFDLRSRVASILQLFSASARSKNLVLASTCAELRLKPASVLNHRSARRSLTGSSISRRLPLKMALPKPSASPV